MKGYSSCKIIIGTRAKRLLNPISDLTHEWTVYVKAPRNIVKSVQYKLHESFTNNTVVTEYPFELTECGWGEFTIQIKIVLMNDERLLTSHFLKLHGSDIVINETVDEIVFKGTEKLLPLDEEETIEYKKISDGINQMLSLLQEDD